MIRRLIILLLIVGCGTEPEDCVGVVDIDGNCYATVQIGEQLWMAENLKTTHYNNGDSISYITNNADWGSSVEGQYGIYINEPANANIYGNLYNFSVVIDERGICPSNFHISSDEDWKEMEIFLGMNLGSKLAGNSDLWIDGDLKNNSEFGTSGFNALPAGRFYPNYVDDMGCFFWTPSPAKISRTLSYNRITVHRDGRFNRELGFSIRCLKD